MSSISSVGEFLSRGDTDRECQLKKRWLEAKKAEEARRAEYCAEVRARLQEEDEEKRRAEEEAQQVAEEPDPNLVEWDVNDPESPQQCNYLPLSCTLVLLTNNRISLIRDFSTKGLDHSIVLRADSQCYFCIVCSINDRSGVISTVPCRFSTRLIDYINVFMWIVSCWHFFIRS